LLKSRQAMRENVARGFAESPLELHAASANTSSTINIVPIRYVAIVCVFIASA
jgi:hypothetical protein